MTEKLYKLMEEWIKHADSTGFDNEFKRLEKEEFGDVVARIQNPLARAYKQIRDDLIRYKETNDKKFLDLAKEKFSMVLKTYE